MDRVALSSQSPRWLFDVVSSLFDLCPAGAAASLMPALPLVCLFGILLHPGGRGNKPELPVCSEFVHRNAALAK